MVQSVENWERANQLLQQNKIILVPRLEILYSPGTVSTMHFISMDKIGACI